MPIVKKNKQLDGANSIYSASRKLAARQLKNMKSPATDDGETVNPQNPIPTSSNTADSDGLIPQLLQNLNDVNGLMSSLRLVGGKSKKGVPRTPQAIEVFDADDDEDVVPGKRPRRGAGLRHARSTRSRKLDTDIPQRALASVRYGGARNRDDIEKLKRKIGEQEERMRLQENVIRDTEEKIRKLRDTPSPPSKSEREFIANTYARYKEDIKEAKDEIRRAKGNIKNYRNKIEKLESEDEEKGEDKGITPEMRRVMNMLTTLLENAKITGEYDDDAAQALLERINDAHARNGMPILGIDARFNLYEVPRPDDGGGEGEPGPRPLPPLPPIIRPDEIEAYDDGDDGDAEEIDISSFDFSKVSKSTLLVILNQLRSLVKKGDILLKKIVHSNIKAGEGDLDQITQEVASLISSKRFLLSHINQISSKGREIAEYLYSILSEMVGKYIENLKTYVKRYAQLNREQINSIQEDTADEVANEAGAGRPSPSVGHRPIVMSDAVRRISGFSRKYLL